MQRALLSFARLCAEPASSSCKAFCQDTSALYTSTRAFSKQAFSWAGRHADPSHKLPAQIFLAPTRQSASVGRLTWWRLHSTLAAEASAQSIETTASKVHSLWGSLSEGLSDGARRQLVWWLGGCSAWVFSMVVLGGVTRLTRSGLSMTDWKFTGERPPLTQEDWELEFAKYQASPEYRKVHSRMTLEEFKFIFWMEYAHRMWGRLLGVVFAVPGAYFLAKGYIRPALAKRLGLLFLMGGAQGLVGWWMVRSGLQELQHEYQVPRVSPYRLAAHLTSAFAIYTMLLWTTLSIASPAPLAASLAGGASAALAALRSRVLPLSALVGVTAVSGAFVAGLDAGRAYNDFPWMNGKLVPEEYWNMTGWRNFFENTAAVQFNHRVLAVSTLTGVGALWASTRGLPLPPSTRLLVNALAAVTGLQVALGITTLMTYVPVSLGSAHQAGALTLFSVAIALLHNLRASSPSQPSILVSTLGTPVAAAAVLGIAGAVMYNY